MNRKTVTILCAAGGLAAAAAILGTRPHVIPAGGDPVVAPTGTPVPGPVATGVCGDGNAPAMATTSFGPGDMTAALSGGNILQGGDGELYLSVDLAAKEAESTNRPPLNVAVVLDHSGSMQGEKIAKAREAAHGLVSRLRETDHVALIQFDDVAEVVVPSIAVDAAGKVRLDQAIDTIVDRGGTNLHGGLTLGRDEVLRNLRAGTVNRVILMSDGNANVGITSVPQLAQLASDASEKGVRITTVGLGLDYNEDLMEAVAEHGRGAYYYVKDAEGLGKVFAGELHAIQSTVATRAELRLEPSCAGVEIAEVYGYTTRREGTAMIVPLADFAGGDKRKIVARLKVPVGQKGHVGVVRATMSFADPAGGAARATVASLGVEVTPDVAIIDATANKNVVSEVTAAQSSIALRQAAVDYQNGDQAAALRGIKEQRARAEMAQKKYKLEDKDLAGVYGELDTMGGGMAANAPSSAAAPAFTKAAKASANHMAK